MPRLVFLSHAANSLPLNPVCEQKERSVAFVGGLKFLLAL
jgi:hypothetical protein